MKCKFCGSEVNELESFCSSCGAVVKKPAGVVSQSQPITSVGSNARSQSGQATSVSVPQEQPASLVTNTTNQQSELETLVSAPQGQLTSSQKKNSAQGLQTDGSREVFEQMAEAFITGMNGDPLSNATLHYLEIFDVGCFSFHTPWNWGALLLGFWSFYRRMNLLALFNLFPASIVLPSLVIEPHWIVVMIPFMVINALAGDALYYLKFKYEYNKAQKLYPNSIAAQRAYLVQKGGTRKWAIFVWTGILIFVYFVYMVV